MSQLLNSKQYKQEQARGVPVTTRNTTTQPTSTPPNNATTRQPWVWEIARSEFLARGEFKGSYQLGGRQRVKEEEEEEKYENKKKKRDVKREGSPSQRKRERSPSPTPWPQSQGSGVRGSPPKRHRHQDRAESARRFRRTESSRE